MYVAVGGCQRVDLEVPTRSSLESMKSMALTPFYSARNLMHDTFDKGEKSVRVGQPPPEADHGLPCRQPEADYGLPYELWVVSPTTRHTPVLHVTRFWPRCRGGPSSLGKL